MLSSLVNSHVFVVVVTRDRRRICKFTHKAEIAIVTGVAQNIERACHMGRKMFLTVLTDLDNVLQKYLEELKKEHNGVGCHC
jgi:hypothetical protein